MYFNKISHTVKKSNGKIILTNAKYYNLNGGQVK